ncbi:hypothetical protein K505DRAFT_237181 [Melanomma pulvis-pyrius CBS 109.77]|uniref:Uncharacterized protein n=1 Tax=Melanomma pulvis-pyrius CBS 109.77 TaxID=1314802 RepID=A0A6A6XKQ8_9PLEO|nr:hypothetical protein K505DRAFT_237181 [Melanomma pulvis-pyrius CBS 109.77]
MHFRRQSPTNDFITARFPNPKVGHLSPSNVSISTYHTPETIEEALALSSALPQPVQHHAKNASQSRQPLQRSQSSNWWMEIRKSPTPKQEPQSRKTNHATIITDATETQPAFESDRFAIQMPTTREPILDPPVFRAKLPSPSRAQVEAYQTYKKKAQQVRETNHKDGVRVPSKIISYDYANNTYAGYTQPMELDVSPPNSPPKFTPAGAFPISPPIPQHTWGAQPKHHHIQGPRSMSDSTHLNIASKPVEVGNMRSHDRRVYHRGDASSGAASHFTTPSLEKDKIKVRLKPPTATRTREDSPQKESWWTLYNRSPQSSTDGSRSPSPTKLSFKHTTVPVIADAVFGHGGQGISGTSAAAKPKDKAANTTAASGNGSGKATPKHAQTSRWAWLRPAGPRVAKPTHTHVPAKATTYVDPFVQHATPAPTHPNTPVSSRPNSPRKLAPRHAPQGPPPSKPKGKFETGFAQVTTLTSLVIRVCLIVYVLVGLYFLLDAVREAVHTLGAPFRLLKGVGRCAWGGVVWLGRWLAWAWERWGVKIVARGGWRGRWW